MRTCIATVSLFGTLEEKLDAIAAAGFDAIELFAGDIPDSAAAAREVKARADDLGLAIDLFQPLRDVEGVPHDQFAANLERAERAFDLSEALGAPMVLICSNAGVALDDDALAADQLAMVAERAARRQLRIGYEALAWGTRVSTWDHAWRIVQRANRPELGLILDSFHVLVRPEPWKAISQLPGERLFFVQVGDAPIVDTDYMTWRRNHSTLPGSGELNVASFVEAVNNTGYKGPLSLEIFNTADRTPALERAAAAIDSVRHLIANNRR